MITAIIGLVLGMIIIRAGCRFFDIPSLAHPRLTALSLLAMTLGFVAAGQLLPAGH